MVAEKHPPPPPMFLMADHAGMVACPAAEVSSRLEHVARMASKENVQLGPVIRAQADVVRDWTMGCELGDVIQLPMLQLTIIRIGTKPDSVKQVAPEAAQQAAPRIAVP